MVEFEMDLSSSMNRLFEWLDNEFEIQPKILKESLIDGCGKLSLNFNYGGIE